MAEEKPLNYESDAAAQEASTKMQAFYAAKDAQEAEMQRSSAPLEALVPDGTTLEPEAEEKPKGKVRNAKGQYEKAKEPTIVGYMIQANCKVALECGALHFYRGQVIEDICLVRDLERAGQVLSPVYAKE